MSDFVKDTNVPTNDCISRQAAIDAVYKCADIFAGDMPIMVVKSDAYEALAQLPSAQLEPCEDAVSRAELIETVRVNMENDRLMRTASKDEILNWIDELPSAQPEPCEYYALCRHGRDENKLRASLKFCDYCNEDSDGYVKPIEKNGHAFVRFGMDGWELSLKANGWHGSAKIRYCPMCGRDLLVK